MKKIMIATLLAALSACGGGGSDGATSDKTELEGRWAYASGGHTTGGTCGLDVHGGYEERDTLIFTGSKVSGIKELCAIASGNTGAFIQTNTYAGTFVLGGVYLTYGGVSYKTIDVTTTTTQYSGYNLNGDKLKLAQIAFGNDGSTPAKRINGVELTGQPVLLRQ